MSDIMLMLNTCIYLATPIVVPTISFPIEGERVVFTCTMKDLKNQTTFDVEFMDNNDMPYVNKSGINILIIKDEGEKIFLLFLLEGQLFCHLLRSLTRLIPPVFSIPPEYRKREVLFLGGIEINHWYDCRRMFAYQGTLKISVVRKERL